jgi:hypothetical protein
MKRQTPQTPQSAEAPASSEAASLPLEMRLQIAITNYSLSSICPSCGAETYKHACKVRCSRCGFAWDCSEL